MLAVVISAWPYAANTPSGAAGAYGLHHSAALRTDTNEQLRECGISAAAARRQAQKAAEAAWGAELIAFLNEEDLFTERLEAGDVDPCD